MKQRFLVVGAVLLVIIGAGILSFYYGRAHQPTDVLTADNTPEPQKSDTTISGMVVPQDNLVKAQREALFADIKKKIDPPKTVILLSPNHNENGAAVVQTSTQTWDLADNRIAPNKGVLDDLLKAEAVAETPESFVNEQSIKLVLGDIAHNFPDAQIVPLIFKLKTPKAVIEQIHDILKEKCAHCLMVASVDFSQSQPALLANLHDDFTLRGLQNRDADSLLDNAEVDSPPSLALLSLWAKSHDTQKFVLQDHTNSGEMVKDPDAETTTHMFGWYEKGDAVVPETSVSFVLGGDMMYGRNVRHNYLAAGLTKLFANLGDRTFWGADARVANLEGPLSEVAVPDDYLSTNLIFNFSPETIDALKYLKLNAVSLANNHTDNKGATGLASTHKLLDAANIKAIGGPNDSDVPKVVTFKGQNLDLTIIGVHAVFTSPNIIATVREQAAKPNNKVLVFPHWGQEYKSHHSGPQEVLAHAWVDAGADAVIGAHPHVIQDAEVYKNVPIFYSLGNFIFDQYFSSETQQGLFVAGKFTDKGVQVFALPIQGKKSQVSLMKGATKKTVLDTLYAPVLEYKKDTAAGELIDVPQQ